MEKKAWYSSTSGATVSLTIKGIVASLLPLVKNFFGVEIVSEQTDPLIDAVVTIVGAIIATIGYTRAKSTMEGRNMGGVAPVKEQCKCCKEKMVVA